MVLTEFTAPPLWVPSKIALWRGSLLPPSSSRAAIRCCSSWRRIRTLFTSGGKTDCKSTRASLGSSAALAYDADEGSWNVFYVGFVSCNDTSFVNRRGRIFRAVATVAGPTAAGIESSYVDADIAIEPNSTGAQRWEGTYSATAEGGLHFTAAPALLTMARTTAKKSGLPLHHG